MFGLNHSSHRVVPGQGGVLLGVAILRVDSYYRSRDKLWEDELLSS